MKVLHIWEQGISSIIAKTMDRIYDTKSTVIMREKYDPFHHNTVSKNLECGTIEFYFRALLKAQTQSIVHLHTHDKFMPLLYTLGCKTVLHYHGTDIRGRWRQRKKYWSAADAIIVSTRNMLEGAPKEVIHVPNPVDTELFKPHPHTGPPRALHFTYEADDLAKQIASAAEIPLDILPRTTPRSEIPALFQKYTHYIDAKRKNGEILIEKTTDTGSLTGLEALASGLTVLTLSGLRMGLPQEHQPEVAVKKIHTIYEEVLK